MTNWVLIPINGCFSEVHKNSILGDTLYVVMEKGDTDFDKYLRKRSRSGLSDTLMIRFHWAEMLKAMQVVPNEGVFHSDLKPYNFLLVGGELKLIDFGLASVVARERTSVTRDLLGGTPFYMSPESFKGLADPELGAKIKVTVKSDVWSLGCILYEMLCGQTPFEHMRGKQLFDAILNDQTFIEYKQGPDPSLINIVKTCLQRNPTDRPTVDELLDNKCDLDALKNSPPMARKSETVLLFGGLVDGNISDEIREYSYNMTTESTSVLNIKMKRARFWHSVGLNKWANEFVIAGGGNTTNNAELCTLAMNKNSFSFVELPNLNKERYGASSCALVMDNLTSRKKREVLVHEGRQYTKQRLLPSGKVRWVCRNRKHCAGAVLTTAAGLKQVSVAHSDLCLTDPEGLEAAKMFEGLKAAVNQEIHRTVPELYTQALNQTTALGPDIAARFPPLISCQSTLHRLRSDNRPPLPQTFEEVEIPEAYHQTQSGKDFLLHQSEDKKIMIFGTMDNVRKLVQLRQWNMDGTFDIVPKKPKKLWEQMVTIQAFSGQKLLPLVYVLMKNKATEDYVKVFRILKDLAGPDVFRPIKIRCDFESGLLPAFRREFQDSVIQGCYFHFGQAVQRNVVKHLGNLYDTDPIVRFFVRDTKALAFLPPADVQDAYRQLREGLPDGYDEILAPFFTYMDYWFTNPAVRDLWNVHRELRRTNNNQEGWHSRMNRRIRKNPDLYTFLTGILEEQGHTEGLIAQISAGNFVNRPNKAYVAVNQRITTLTDKYLDGETPVLEFLRGIAHNIAQPLPEFV